MIHRDFCNPRYTKDYSPLRMQFHFLLSRNVCLDGLVPLTRKEITHLLSCDIQSVDKFIKRGIQEGILDQQGERLFLLKRVSDYHAGYVKHLPFLESKTFLSLKLHTQRFILYTLWAGASKQRPLKREISALYHSTPERNGVLNLYDKASLYPILEQAKEFLHLEVIQQKGKEMVRVLGLVEPFASQEPLENEGEQKWLDDVLFEECCDEIIPPAARVEMIKLKKHYWTSFQSYGLELFWHGLKKLLASNKLYELIQQGERPLGAYFYTILEDMKQKLLPTLQRLLDNTLDSLQAAKRLSEHVRQRVTGLFSVRAEKLKRMIGSIQKQIPKDDLNISFPFYNWLENQPS